MEKPHLTADELFTLNYIAELRAGMTEGQRSVSKHLSRFHVDLLVTLASAPMDVRGEAIRLLAEQGLNTQGQWIGGKKQSVSQVLSDIAALNISEPNQTDEGDIS